jgi:DNA replication protein DnaC
VIGQLKSRQIRLAIADAICNRIIHNAHRIELEGDSVRKIYANN